jgi:head-tail adaptor
MEVGVKCACPANAPRLQHRVTIERPTYTQDSANEQIASWGTYAVRRALCRAMTAREVVQSEQVQGSVGWVIEMTYDPKTSAITSDMRMTLHSFGNRTVYCDGPSMPLDADRRRVKVRAMEQTA